MDLTTLNINDRPYTANAKNLPLIAYIETLGIHIPHFCYHNELLIAGNCRMCVIEAHKIRKPVMSCVVDAESFANFSLFTLSPLVLKSREGIVEVILVNHPIDCAICDQAGECDLQEYSGIFGATDKRFYNYKRNVFDINTGPVVMTNLTRCIHCTRCVRFGVEVAGFKELGMYNRGRGSQIGIYKSRNRVSTELAGNFIDLCPVSKFSGNFFSSFDDSENLTVSFRLRLRLKTIIQLYIVFLYLLVVVTLYLTDVTSADHAQVLSEIVSQIDSTVVQPDEINGIPSTDIAEFSYRRALLKISILALNGAIAWAVIAYTPPGLKIPGALALAILGEWEAKALDPSLISWPSDMSGFSSSEDAALDTCGEEATEASSKKKNETTNPTTTTTPIPESEEDLLKDIRRLPDDEPASLQIEESTSVDKTDDKTTPRFESKQQQMLKKKLVLSQCKKKFESTKQFLDLRKQQRQNRQGKKK